MNRLALATAFLGCILAANYVTTEFGMVTMLGIGMTAGTFFAGATFVLRDSLQDAAGKWAVVALIVAGAWSYGARQDARMGIRHCSKKTCANCLHYALAWRERLLARLNTRQMALPLYGATA